MTLADRGRLRKILVLSRYDQNGASSRVRFYQFAPELEALGWQLEFSPLLGEDIVATIGRHRGLSDWAKIAAAYVRRIGAAFAAHHYDLVWIEKELLPFAPGLVEAVLRPRAVPYVVDYDDAIFHNYDAHRSGLVRRLFSRKLDWLLKGSALVTAGSRYLEEYATRHGAQRVVAVPSCVQISNYPKTAYPGGPELRLGWIGGVTTSPLLIGLLPVLQEAARRLPLRVVAIGAGNIALPGVPLEQHRWSLAEESLLLASCHAGVMPLHDSLFEKGKCAFKLVQYGAAGRPSVASPVGANCDVLTSETGRLADSAEEWLHAIEDCHANPRIWAEMGQAARRRCETNYSVEAVSVRLAGHFREILDRPN
ncbi:glycosyltransferase family 4 protein [Allopontixanthobacter sp.]|uniref:glycosyltransferase family 4 protein n=1 Tax=Allopontixanthobacter sp. TaxID=2906452 RepID=UPI002AB8D0A6|nr:glycosyltransferase family 4 protein [Allopontixanthobacter sp.]MDZ4307434.1 glycosyltransferase family 4 protein [Allopontixanthobacter sp.]